MGLRKILWRKEWLYNIPTLLWWFIWEFTKDTIIEATRNFFTKQGVVMSVLEYLLTHPGIIALAAFIVIAVIIYIRYNKETPEPITDKEGVVTPSRREALESAQVAWGLWHTGTRMRIEKLLDMKSLKRILLLEPNTDNPSIGQTATKSGDKPDSIVRQLIETTNEALDNGIEVKWYFIARESSITIFDSTPIEGKPCSENAWIYVEYFSPHVGVDQRRGERIDNKGKNKSRFVGYYKEYEDIWGDPSKSIQAVYTLGNDIIPKTHGSRSDTIDALAELISEANKLKIIWANQSTPELNEVYVEAIDWTKKAIKVITDRLGETEGKKLRILTELPLNGEIRNDDFMVQYAHSQYPHELGLIRDRHYKVLNWIKDFIQSSSLGADKEGSQT